jgi:2-phospho-L-lactate/phosphoenolpyruvate guanylyltransferase
MANGPAVLIPVKSFATAKARLGETLDPSQRAELARTLATAVVAAAAPHPVFVATDDPEVAQWATGLGATVVDCPAPGLDAAVRRGVAAIAAAGHDRVLIAHGDLSDPAALAGLFDLDGTVLVPDDRLDGTNVVVVSTRGRFVFSYGPGSFARHLSEAERMGGPIHIVRDPGLSLDLDGPADLDEHRRRAGTAMGKTP